MSESSITTEEVAEIYYDAPGMQSIAMAGTFERWLTAHDARIASDALKQAAQDMRSAKRLYDSWNLTDPEDPEISYSPDRWLEVYADRIASYRLGGGS